MKNSVINIEEFINKRDKCIIIDVRSPSEFIKGHIPGAFNIPLFSDQERAIVGTKYVQENRFSSVLAGLKMVGPRLSSYITQVKELSDSKNLLVYCWRGGMRSASMAWLFNLAGFNCEILEGGYRSYRRFVQSYFSIPFRLIVLGGMTGSGKTELLLNLSQKGQQIIDLEGLANHKGSAFGAIGQKPQPSTEHFENLLFETLFRLDAGHSILVEDESKSIGSVFVPMAFYQQMTQSPTIAIEVPFNVRLSRLKDEYTRCNPDLLIAAIEKISKKLGPDSTKKCIQSVRDGDFTKAIEIVLIYYDKTYQYGLINKKYQPKIIHIQEGDDSSNISSRLIEEITALNLKTRDEN